MSENIEEFSTYLHQMAKTAIDALKDTIGEDMEVVIAIFPSEEALKLNEGADSMPAGMHSSATPAHTLNVLEQLVGINAPEEKEESTIYTPPTAIILN